MKRLSTAEPLTYDDVAARLDKAALRTLRILMDIRHTEGDLFENVKRSRYLIPGTLEMLAGELNNWGVTPQDPDELRRQPPSPSKH